ncbi:HAD family hydrolase [Actinokineospora sp. G85]|uniref:HAD family hydrolase n=1 Tax=Actinokineospora sp. G85 TaxID=3406626 RepID=UPI003C781BF3
MRAVIFDWGGTLTPWMSMDHLAAWRAYADAVFPDNPERAASLAAAALAAEDDCWLRVRVEHRSFTLTDVLDRAGGPADPAAMEEFRKYWDHATPTSPEVKPMLEALHERGLRTGVLSSTFWPATWHEAVLERDGVWDLFHGAVWSSDLDYTKPHREAFLAAMAAVGEENPAECVYVGDRPYDDISGAKAVGMKAVWVPHSQIPVAQQSPVSVDPDAVIQSLSEIPSLVDRWM